jgi:outer membrane immunogenic protein
MKALLVGCVTIGALAAVGSAGAADIPARINKAPPVAPAYNWTGFYIGIHAGGAWLNSTDIITPANGLLTSFFVPPTRIATSLPLSSSGFIGGGQLGYNWQVNPMWVVGWEADISGTDLNSTVSLPGPGDFTRIVTESEKIDWFGTARGRVGVTPWDRALLYVTGGLAYANVNLSTALTRISGGGIIGGCNGSNNCQSGSVTSIRSGWTVGGGLEWAFAGDWRLKAEYLYFDLGTISHSMTDPFFPAIFTATADLKGSIARVGLNYKIGWGGPVVARY